MLILIQFIKCQFCKFINYKFALKKPLQKAVASLFSPSLFSSNTVNAVLIEIFWNDGLLNLFYI